MEEPKPSTARSTSVIRTHSACVKVRRGTVSDATLTNMPDTLILEVWRCSIGKRSDWGSHAARHVQRAKVCSRREPENCGRRAHSSLQDMILLMVKILHDLLHAILPCFLVVLYTKPCRSYIINRRNNNPEVKSQRGQDESCPA